MLTATQVRDDVERLLDRAEATGELPFGLLRRWSSALGSDALWRFETTIVLGGVDPASFVFEDDADGVPVVTGLLTWGGVGVGDPAVDLRWTSSAPEAQSDVIEAYVRASHRAPDSQLAERARLHAELEFAKWLLHAHESGSRDLVADAVALLTSLDESVRDQPAVIHGSVSADEAIAASARVPSTLSGPVDTSMHTDTFDLETLASFPEDEARGADQRGADQREDAGATVPIELSGWTGLAVGGHRTHAQSKRVEGDAPGLPRRPAPARGGRRHRRRQPRRGGPQRPTAVDRHRLRPDRTPRAASCSVPDADRRSIPNDQAVRDVEQRDVDVGLGMPDRAR